MVLTRIFTVRPAMARNGDHTVMVLLVALDSCKLTVKGTCQLFNLVFYDFYSRLSFKFTAKMMSHTTVHSFSIAQQQSKLLMVKDVQDVEALFSPLNNNLPKVQCGTRNASAATNVIVHWIQCLLVTDLIRKFIAVHATDACLDQKVSDMATHQPCQLMENQL